MTGNSVPQRHGQDGFTLIEVLVGLALSALIMVALNLATGAIGRGADRARLALGQQADISAALEIVAGDVSGILRIRTSAPGEPARYLFEGTPRSATYVLAERRGRSGDALYRVRLSVRQQGGVSELVRERAALDPGPVTDAPPAWGDAVVLLSGPYEIALDYRAPRAQARDWTPGWNSAAGPPEQIRLMITDRATGRLKVPVFVRALQPDAELQCATPEDPVCGTGDAKAATQ